MIPSLLPDVIYLHNLCSAVQLSSACRLASVFFLGGLFVCLVFEGKCFFLNIILLVVFLKSTTKQYQVVTFVLSLTVCIVAHLKIQAIDSACEVLVSRFTEVGVFFIIITF